MNILILYATQEGQTEKVANRMAENLRKQGHKVTTQSGEHLPATFNFELYDAAVIGGSIHMGHYPRYLKKYVTQHRDWLNNVPSAFFTVCMAVKSKLSASRQEAIAYGENFIKETGWRPALIATFAGAVKYTHYNLITRFIMKRIARGEGGSTDTSQDHEYTDWDAVQRFTEQFDKNIAALQEG
ncbi:MAG: menaquinone-dependent protoporphyrinogen IX dehydrogenase [Gammaproteobacteria bacterium]|jgi:menaquinone-dependent protoporphyrinogen oxidase